MISLPPDVRIFLCVAPTDMRCGFDGLRRLAEEQLERDPLTGGLYLFLNRRRDRAKLLWWDGDGLCLWYKRLEAGNFQLPALKDDCRSATLSPTDLALLLGGIDLASVRRRKRFSRTT